MVQTAAWLPWLLLALDRLGERLSPRRLALTGLLGGALALPGHFQTALYAASGASVWALSEAIVCRDPRRRLRLATGIVALAGWGSLLAAVMILPGLELTANSLRARFSAFDSDVGYFHPDSLLTLVQPNYYGLLSGHYTGPGDSTQHYFYAGILLVPLALLGLRHARLRRTALVLGVPFLWYALGPAGGLFRLVARLPGFHSVELPMHGWFLPALGLALLGAAPVVMLRRWLQTLLIGVVAVDVLVVNQLLNPLAFARHSFDELYGSAVRSFGMQLAAIQPPVQRLYGPPLAAIGYRNHPLQSYVETTYGYNPLELAAYADYADAAERNPRLIDGLAATHRLEARSGQEVSIQPNPSALPLAYFAREVTSVADDAEALARLAELDPAHQTLVVGPQPIIQMDDTASAMLVERAADHLTIHYRSRAAGLLRLAIPFFPGWQAQLNDQTLATLRVDYALLGVIVPAGEGDVQVAYAPRLFWLGATLSIVALAASLVALLAPGDGRRRC
jgi:hypothetical protein